MRLFVPARRALARHVGAGDATPSFDIRILIVVNLKKPMKSDELARFIENGWTKEFLLHIIYKEPLLLPHTSARPFFHSFPHRGLDSDGGNITHWGLVSNGKSAVLGNILSIAIVLVNCGALH